ncbi:GntR family transcriptional regulator [Oscillospiraceae bacterium MB08-C2-2]|nr:GntR family transcriptional regulator [Oscillospiraceae bacterium MB08-C2-2]
MVIRTQNLSESASDYAYWILHTNIIQMLLPPGTVISPAELAGELKISRTPIQSACARLAAEGLLTIVPQKGSYVSIINLQRVYESVYMRSLLDQAAARLLCASSQQEELFLALQANLHQQEFILENNLQADMFELDNQFHSILYQWCEMDNIRKAIVGISADQNRVRYMKLKSKIRLGETISEHKEIFYAIKQRDSESAARLSHEHVAKFGEDIARVYYQNPSYFSHWEENLPNRFASKQATFYIPL